MTEGEEAFSEMSELKLGVAVLPVDQEKLKARERGTENQTRELREGSGEAWRDKRRGKGR